MLGVICCVTILPSFILVFDKAIWKTAHKTVHLPTDGLSEFVMKHYKLFAIIMVVLWIPALYGNANYNVYYKLDNSLPDYLPSVQANQELNSKFDMNSVEMILCRDDLSQKEVKAMLKEIQNVDGINFALGLDSLTGDLVPDELIPQSAREKMESGGYQLLMLSSKYEVATDEVNDQCNKVEQILKKYDEKGMLIGEAPCTRDLIKITDHDFMVVSAVSILAIFVIILLGAEIHLPAGHPGGRHRAGHLHQHGSGLLHRHHAAFHRLHLYRHHPVGRDRGLRHPDDHPLQKGAYGRLFQGGIGQDRLVHLHPLHHVQCPGLLRRHHRRGALLRRGLDRLPVPAHGTRRHHQYVCCHLYHAQYVYAA